VKDLLFNPIVIKGLEIRNRIFMPAMHLNMCRNYEVTDQLLAFYEERARGGAGMITVGYASVNELAAHSRHIGAHLDEFIPGLARLAKAIRKRGARAAVQLNHAGRYNHSFLLGGRQPVAPSAVPSRLTGETPRELTAEEIGIVIEDFARSALRVREAGFDAVEILTGTGYLISEFLSPVTNRRTDDYGGCLENRMRFGLEVVRRVRNQVGGDFPMVMRVNGNDFMAGGIGRWELQQFARELELVGADAFCVNAGWHEAAVPQIVTRVPRGVFAYLARGIREQVSVPVIASHRINDPTVARQMIGDALCDAVAMGRALIADPDLPEKARNGREAEIIHCVACGQGCFDSLFRMQSVSCLCNPGAGREYETTQVSGKKSRIMVVGGGAAGLSAALAAAEAGHAVALYEQSDRLGGQLHLAGVPPGRAEFAGLAEDLARQVAARDIKVVLQRQVDEQVVEDEQPEAVILATGGTPAVPPIQGIDAPHVMQAWDVLAGRAEPGRRVVVIGGGAVGVETALTLAEQGTLSAEAVKFLLIHGAESPEDLLTLAVKGTREIVLVEMLKEIGTNFGKTTRWGMLQDVKRYGIRTLVAASVLAITPESVWVEQEGKEEEIPADTVVLAVGTRPLNPLVGFMEHRGIPFRVVGDADQVGTAFEAVHQGFAAGRSIGGD
jgi:2,4-dienoyl-CoA reductase (NADPH2)